MLPRRSRIARSSFDRVFTAGARMRLPSGQVLFVPAKDFKMSIVVGKKIEPTATGRNRLRRRLYAALKGLAAEGIHGHFVILTAAPVKAAPFPDVVESFLKAIRSLSGRPPVR